MAGQPFDTSLVAAIRGSAVFCPLITVESMERLVAVTPATVDFVLWEVCVLDVQPRLSSKFNP